jgi:hypothetical protein
MPSRRNAVGFNVVCASVTALDLTVALDLASYVKGRVLLTADGRGRCGEHTILCHR